MGLSFVGVGSVLTIVSVLMDWQKGKNMTAYVCGLGGGFNIAGCVLLVWGG